MATPLLPADKLALNAFAVLTGQKAGNAALVEHRDYINANGAATYTAALEGFFANTSDADLAASMLNNLGLGSLFTQAQAEAYLAANPGNRVGSILALADQLYDYNGTDAALLSAHNTYKANVDGAYEYSIVSANVAAAPLVPAVNTAGQTLVLNGAATAAGTAAGGEVLHLTGDQDVRIDMTNPANQIKGLDLNGDGTIAADGVENNVTGKASLFEIIDAYARNPLNETDKVANFLGDMRYDGTGFGGDGVSTDGNIVLGGLGADTILGGIGNDFLAGGGVAAANGGTDTLSGGRNADFFFAELSLLDNTDGNHLNIDGGTTADDSSAGAANSNQNSDWLLLQASDDDEPVTVVLDDHLVDANGNGNLNDEGSVVSRAGVTVGTLKDVENLDASGNFYGFLDNIDTTLGGAPAGSHHGIGSSAQLNISVESGSTASHKIIGGYDNDVITGGDGADLLMGGNLNMLIDPNLAGIVNDGRDVLTGGSGSDNIVFEADGGVIEGGATQNVDDSPVDTLWLTANSLGTGTASTMTTDGVLRFDLGDGKEGGISNYDGYGGAHAGGTSAGYTADQTNYTSSANRVQVQDMESVVATGLGAIDFAAAGSNNPELLFANQQNFQGYNGNLDLRGTTGANTLYAAAGDDTIEGREGNDMLSGGNGNDDFVFALNVESGDGVDVIHRQADANGDNLWDGFDAAKGTGGTFAQDFGVNSTTTFGPSSLSVDFSAANLADVNVEMSSFSLVIGGITFAVTDHAALAAVTTVADLATLVNAAFHAQDANVTVTATGTVLTVTDTTPAGGRTISTTQADGYAVSTSVTAPGTSTLGLPQYLAPGEGVVQDRLVYASYFDRADGELVHDDAVVGTDITLGKDSYAQDLVINFGADGTRIAEDQSYSIKFTNLTTRDVATIAVNGVTYSLTVGVDLDGNAIGAEDGVGDNQGGIQTAFLSRLTDFINSFMDNDTAVGQVDAAFNGSDTLTLTQHAYNGEQTVFMTTPVVTLVNASNGQAPTAVVSNNAQHEVLLYGFDGRDNHLNEQNVVFVGDTQVNQSYLVTAKAAGQTIAGKEAALVDGGVDDLAGVTVNTANNNPLLATNFSVHGDDFLLGGAGSDTITAGTGDDRVVGSTGIDVLDGGKNYYAVKILGEQEARVMTWNVWEAAHATTADPSLVGKTISSITLIEQSETGGTLQSGLFDDTLIYQQSDFAGDAGFTITLDDFNVTSGGVVELRHGGAGHVAVDGTTSVAAFTNFENIRTVSGTGEAVAGKGQGHDTLNVSALSTATGGISYDLTNGLGQGEVMYSANAHADGDLPVTGDFESLVLKVDGVESVIGGNGDDLVLIDETEAAKNNSFSGGLGDDRIVYSNDYNAAVEATAEPTVTIKVNSASDTDTVTMTQGRVGTTVATDTLTSVEVIALAGETATGAHEADVLDVASLTAGAIVNYADTVQQAVLAAGSAVGTVRDLAGNVQVSIENLYQVETVQADGNDTVIVADANIMGMNTREDSGVDATAAADLTFSTFLDFDELNASNQRVDFNSLAAGAGTGSGQIENAFNQNEFTFDLSHTGGGSDVDTVDYSEANDLIAVVVDLNVANADQYVLVDAGNAGSGGYTTFTDVANSNSRVDRLIGVEQIVASTAESVLDLTGSTKDLEIKFNKPVAADRVASSAVTMINAYDATSVKITDMANSAVLGRTFLEYVDAADVTDVAGYKSKNATWNRIEGSDQAERVIAASTHSTTNDTYNLRGGANEVKYNELTRSITTEIGVSEWNAASPLTSGLITVSNQFQDGAGNLLANTGTHTITSYTQQNGIASGSLTLAASQDAEDTVSFVSGQDKLFILGVTGTTDNQVEVKVGSSADQNSILLTGYELLADGATNDVYDMNSLTLVTGNLTLVDNGANDHDTIKVRNDADLAAYNGGVPGNTTISLAALNTVFGFDFDVLDVTGVTATTVTTVLGTAGITDEVVLGAINNIATLTDFESVVLTDAALAQTGNTFVLDTTADTLTGGAKVLSDSTGTLNTVSFRGLVLENALDNGQVANVSSDVTFSVAGSAVDAVTVYGGDGNDTITGGSGADTLRGGAGNDTLDGGFVPEKQEVHSYTISSPAGAAGETVIINGVTITEGAIAPGDTGGVLVADNDADAIGAAFVRSWNIDPTQFTVNNTSVSPNTVASVSYDALTNVLSFTFAAGMDPADGFLGVAAGSAAASVSAETVSQPFVARAESADTYVFEATAAANGVDTLNNVDASDTLDFTAFFGGVGVAGATSNGLLASTTYVTGFVDIVYNKASLSAADFTASSTSIVNNAKVVFLVTSDSDGAADATSDGYSVYYVHDADASAAVSLVVELVGTVNSAAELSTVQAAGLI